MDSVTKYVNDCAKLFQLLGHFHFNVKNLLNRNQGRWYKLGYIVYSIFLLLFLSSSIIVHTSRRMSKDYVQQLTAKNLLHLLLLNSTFAGWVLETIVILAQTYVATPLTEKFILNCLKLAKRFGKGFQHFIDHKAIRDQLIRHTLFVVAFFGGTICFQYFFSRFSVEKKSSVESSYLLMILPVIFLTTSVLKFIFLVRFINTHLEAIHTVVLQTFPKFSIAHVVNGVFIKPVTIKLYRETTLKLKIISNLYLIIAENAELVNRSMGKSILVVTAVQVVSTIAGTYLLVMTAVGKYAGSLSGT